MTAVPRSRTSYDYYNDQLQEDYFEDTSDYIPIQGRQTPAGMVRPCSPGGPSIHGERQSRSRTRNVRPGLGSRSRTQRLRPTTAIPWIDVRQSMPDRLEVDENPFTKPMDPINKQYYYKQWRRNPPQPQKPINREGRLGSPWRHIKACINNAGNHLVFIDGTIKSEENFFYPPEDMYEPPNFNMYMSPRMPRRSHTMVPMTYRGDAHHNPYNERARQGFQYWFTQKKPIDCTDTWWTKR